MARLTDNTGRLLGGLDAPLSLLFAGTSPAPPDIKAPAAPPRPPEYGPDEVVFALECSYGALAYLTYSAAQAGAAPSPERRKAPPRDCGRSVEEPGERHHCPACGGSYCAVHAAPAAHDCASVVQR